MAQTNDNDSKASLTDFAFDTDDNWFGVDPNKVGGDQTSGLVKEVKSSGATSSTSATASTKIESKNDDTTVFDDEDEDDDEGKKTFFGEEVEDDDEDEEKKPTKKKKKVKKDDDNPDDLEEEEEGTTNLDKSKKGKGKDEDDEDEDEDEDKTGGKTASKRGGKEGDKTEDEVDDKEFFSNLTKDLKERGIFQAAEIKDEVKSEDEFFELLGTEVETRVSEAFEDFYEKLDEDAVRFLKFKKDGGSTADFFATYATPIDFENFDEKNPNQVQAALTYYLTNVEGLDADELADRLEYLKTGGKERATAAKYVAKLQADREKQVETLQKAAEKAKEKKLKDAENFDKELVEVLEDTEQVGVFPITKTDHKELRNFFTKPTVKVGKNKYVPEFQNKLATILRAQTKEDKQKLIVLAKLIKEDFNVKDLAKEVTTRVTTKVKSNIKKGIGSKVKSSLPTGSKQLSDFF